LPNFVKGCLEASHGSTPVGGPCTDWPVCRSGICHTGISQCVDLCSKDSQCPSTHRCKVLERGQLDDGTTVYFNLCMPVGS
jgi:hypothetical protein